MLEKARQAPVMGYTGRQVSPNIGQVSAGDTGQGLTPVGNQTQDDSAQFQKLLKPTVMEGSRASQLSDRNLLIAMGTSIPCVLETALNSDQPGFTSCEIPRDVLSDNGRVVLLEKGTQVVGEYRGGLTRGQSRLFVLWTRAKTPSGVIVTLASPATDALGRAGFDGYVDVHWWERFGSALLLSVVGDGMQMAGSQLQNSNVQVTNTTASGQNAAAIAVEQSINIPPTLIKHQGELVSIFVARDLDFRSVYRLQTVETKRQIYDRAVTGNF
jgi:type IV secretion system protein VirB10